MRDEKFDRIYEVRFVYPGNELVTRACLAAQAETYERAKGIEDPAAVGAHDHGASQRYAARARSIGIVEGPLPRVGNLNAETPA